MRMLSLLAALLAAGLPAAAHADLYQFLFRGPATVSVNGSASFTTPIQLVGVGDLADLGHAGSGPGYLADVVPLANLSISGAGVGGGAIAAPGEFMQVNADPATYPQVGRRMTMGGVTVAGLLSLSGSSPTVLQNVACLDCAGTLTTVVGDAIAYTFSSAPALTAIGAPAIPEPATWLLLAPGLAALAVRGRRAGR